MQRSMRCAEYGDADHVLFHFFGSPAHGAEVTNGADAAFPGRQVGIEGEGAGKSFASISAVGLRGW